MKSVELFAGAGGLAMGVGFAGFESLGVFERDRWACDTLRQNQQRGYPPVADWPLFEGDVRDFDWSSIAEEVDLLAGGPPCQPFSMGGKHKADNDPRDMFPTTVEIVRRLRPRAFIIENVKGLTRSSFANYYQYILLQLEFPQLARKSNENWIDHLHQLQAKKTSDARGTTDLRYNLLPTLVNAADHGVPQCRERVFIVGFRSDLDVDWSFPNATHGLDALLYSQWVSGEYWERHRVAKHRRPSPPEKFTKRVLQLSGGFELFNEAPWRTVRDALVGLPDPSHAKEIPGVLNHIFQDGAKPYPGHTGSPLDAPAKTLKAGDHGVPGGENMMRLISGDVRYFTVRESARLQTFPDGYVFHGSWTETMRQLGNAVPVALARRVASSVAMYLVLCDERKLLDRRARKLA